MKTPREEAVQKGKRPFRTNNACVPPLRPAAGVSLTTLPCSDRFVREMSNLREEKMLSYFIFRGQSKGWNSRSDGLETIRCNARVLMSVKLSKE